MSGGGIVPGPGGGGGGAAVPSGNAGDRVTLDGAGAFDAITPAEDRAALEALARSFTFAGGSLDYTADANFNPAGATSTTRATSALLGDGVSVPRFFVYGRDLVSALARTTTPGLRATITATDGEPMLQAASGGDGGLNLVFPLWGLPAFQVDLTLASNMPALSAPTGGNFVTARAGLVRWGATDGVSQTIAAVGLDRFGGESGVEHEGGNIDGNAWTRVNVNSSVSGGVLARDVRITVSGPLVAVSTGPVGGALTQRDARINARRRTGRVDHALVVCLGQSMGTPVSFWTELRALTVTPL